MDGSAAFNVMGDWAKGYFTSKGWTPNKEFGWTPVPGTDGTFTVVTDSFAIPVGVKNHDNAVAWLDTLASVEGQDAFNPKKGSIPARVDADVSSTTSTRRRRSRTSAPSSWCPARPTVRPPCLPS